MHILVFKYGNNKTKEEYNQEGVLKTLSPFDQHLQEWKNHIKKGTVTCYKLFHYLIVDDTGIAILCDIYTHPFSPSKPIRIINDVSFKQ